MSDKTITVELTESEALKVVNSLHHDARKNFVEDGVIVQYGKDLLDLADRIDSKRSANFDHSGGD